MLSVKFPENLIISGCRICKTATKFCAGYFSHIEHRVLVTKFRAHSFIEVSQHYIVFCQCHPRSYIVFVTNINLRSEILETP